MRRRLASVVACVLACSAASQGQVARRTIVVDAGSTDRAPAPMSVVLPDKPHLPRFLASLGDGKDKLPAQADVILDAGGNIVGTRIHWIQPAMRANESKSYTLTVSGEAYDITPYFHFVDTPGYRDLLYGDQPVYRYVNHYDPADHAVTYKPFHHVFGFHNDGFITKGPGGMESHHRGLFFGFVTPLGNFWGCKDVHQEHTGYHFETESSGPVAAWSVSTVDWIDASGKAVVRDTRDVAAYRIAKDALVLDFDITAESLTGSDIPIQGNAHHGGFHFRAAQEVADNKPAGAKAFDGGATYVRPPSAKLVKDDVWSDCPWVACNFTIHGNPYTVVHMDHPSNPTPTTYSTRPYGRMGAYVDGAIKAGTPLKLKYRVVVLDAKTHADLSAESIGTWYANFIDPPKVTVK